jgi:hypothetical protein
MSQKSEKVCHSAYRKSLGKMLRRQNAHKQNVPSLAASIGSILPKRFWKNCGLSWIHKGPLEFKKDKYETCGGDRTEKLPLAVPLLFTKKKKNAVTNDNIRIPQD